MWKIALCEKQTLQRKYSAREEKINIKPSKTKEEMKYVFFYSMLPIKNKNNVKKNCFIAILQ